MTKGTFKPNFFILDCLRGIAALYVVINHARGNLHIGGSELALVTPVEQWTIWTKIYYMSLQLTSLGTEFVIFFFVLSGFSIAHSLRNQNNILHFYLKRLIRLYPPYVLALIWAAVSLKLISIFEPETVANLNSVFANFENIILNLFYINRGEYIPQFWSLVFEVIFYILAPLLILKQNIYYIFSLCLFISGIFISSIKIYDGNILLQFIFDYNIYFALGIWLYNNYNKMKPKLIVTKYKVYILSAIIFILMIGLKTWIGSFSKLTFILSSFLATFLIINFQENNIKPKFLHKIGVMSYTLYISHYATIKIYHFILSKIGVINFTDRFTTSYFWILGVLFCLVISYVFYFIAEKPSKLILNKLRR